MTTVRRTLLSCIFAGSCALAASGAAIAHPPEYRLTAIPELSVYELDEAINNRGEIAGNVGTDEGPRAAIYSRGVVTQLGTLGGRESQAFGINDRGDVAGASMIDVPPGAFGLRAFFFSDGLMENLGTVRGLSQGIAVNNRRIVVGYDSDTSGEPQDAFIYRNGRKRLVPAAVMSAINERGQIAGAEIAPVTNVTTAFVFHRGRFRYLGTLPGDVSAAPAAINERGQTIGFSWNAAGVNRMFFHDGRRMHELEGPAVGDMRHLVPVGLNNRGDVTVNENDDTGGTSGAGHLYHDGEWHNLNNLLSPRDPQSPFVTMLRVGGINDRGQIVAVGRNSQTNFDGTYLLTPVSRKRGP
jgi:probable HAF family extracellular repeat protein